MSKVTKDRFNKKNFIDFFLEEEPPQSVDWIRNGHSFKKLISPPKFNPNAKFFSDALKEIIPEKIRLALKAQNSLKNIRRKRLKLILQNIPQKDQFFYFALEAHLFSEYFVILQWVSYWLNLWYRVTKSPKQKQDINRRKFSDLDIQKARDYPIPDLYQGILRKSGDKFFGLCPFHTEKHASFFIFPNNCWHCFGACSEGGDAISFLMKLRNLDFLSAVQQLK